MRRVTWLCLIVFSALAVAQETVDWSSLVSKVSPAVVTIVSADATDIAQGSGFLISSDGKIVTNFHVVEGKKIILARRHDGSFLTITGILAADKANDLVILKADGRNLPFVPLGDSDEVKVGEAICVIGSPMLLEGTVTTGIISAIRELKGGRKLLQISAPISEGSSGSPVFNRKGEVIGIASFQLAEGQNLNFAVPINVLKNLLKQSPENPKPLAELFLPYSVMEEFEQTLQEAFQVAQGIKDDYQRALALSEIAEAMAEVGEKQKATAILNQALKIAQNITNAYDRSWLLFFVSKVMAKVGTLDKAQKIAQNITHKVARSCALSAIAYQMAEQSKRRVYRIYTVQSNDTLAIIAQRFNVPLKDLAQANALSMTGMVKPGQVLLVPVLEVGEKQKSIVVLNQAVKVAQGIKDPLDRSLALSAIAVAMAGVWEKQRSVAILDQALQIAQSITDVFRRARALSTIAYAMVRAEENQKAITILNQALKIAQGITNADDRSLVLSGIAQAMGRAGLFDQAFQVIQRIRSDFDRSSALWVIAEAMAEAGLLERAFEVAKSIEDPIHRLQALATIVAEMRKAGKIK